MDELTSMLHSDGELEEGGATNLGVDAAYADIDDIPAGDEFETGQEAARFLGLDDVEGGGADAEEGEGEGDAGGVDEGGVGGAAEGDIPDVNDLKESQFWGKHATVSITSLLRGKEPFDASVNLMGSVVSVREDDRYALEACVSYLLEEHCNKSMMDAFLTACAKASVFQRGDDVAIAWLLFARVALAAGVPTSDAVHAASLWARQSSAADRAQALVAGFKVEAVRSLLTELPDKTRSGRPNWELLITAAMFMGKQPSAVLDDGKAYGCSSWNNMCKKTSHDPDTGETRFGGTGGWNKVATNRSIGVVMARVAGCTVLQICTKNGKVGTPLKFQTFTVDGTVSKRMPDDVVKLVKAGKCFVFYRTGNGDKILYTAAPIYTDKAKAVATEATMAAEAAAAAAATEAAAAAAATEAAAAAAATEAAAAPPRSPDPVSAVASPDPVLAVVSPDPVSAVASPDLGAESTDMDEKIASAERLTHELRKAYDERREDEQRCKRKIEELTVQHAAHADGARRQMESLYDATAELAKLRQEAAARDCDKKMRLLSFDNEQLKHTLDAQQKRMAQVDSFMWSWNQGTTGP